MLTELELARLKSKLDAVIVLDSNLKQQILQSHIHDFAKTVETKLKRTKGKLVLCLGEMR